MSLGYQTDTANRADKFNLSTPAGWAMLYFIVAVVILSLLFFSV